MNDAWETITTLERTFVNSVLDNIDDAYSQIDRFQEEFKAFTGSKHAIATCNGTSTLHSAVFASGAKIGSEVIVPSVTWHASITPILHCGATPVFCEVDAETYCADPEDVRKRITDKTCAIIVTHVYGNPADMDAFRDLVHGTNITLIEDASHAHGALWSGKSIGTLGDIGCFSLQGSKPVTGIEAGIITTDNDDLYDQMLALGQYGRCEQHFTTEKFKPLRNMGLGIKYRANPLGIAMARAQLQRLSELNEKRRSWFDKMDGLLSAIPGIHPQKTYTKALRGGMLLYTGVIDEETIGAPVSTVLKALVAEGVKTTPAITPFGYGAMHTEPLFNEFPLGDLGGPWGDMPENARKPMAHGSLPISEKIHDSCFWLTTPVDPSPEWVDQVALAFEKVASNGSRLAEISKA
jgi:perosamine synthetase